LNFFTLFTRRGGDTFYVFFCPPDAAGPPLFGGFGIESSPASRRVTALRVEALSPLLVQYCSLYFFFFVFFTLLFTGGRSKLTAFFIGSLLPRSEPSNPGNMMGKGAAFFRGGVKDRFLSDRKVNMRPQARR
jgi:hypothetical protein